MTRATSPTPRPCPACGASVFLRHSSRVLKCAYCGTLFDLPPSGPQLLISKGARVTLAKNANVIIHGNVEIEGGATVDIAGKVTLSPKNESPDPT